jgi:hypothetical protein
MSAYEPPTAVYPIFDSLAFQTPNNASLTIAEADQRYLARQNTATSVATITSFTGGISVPSISSASTINFTSNTLSCNIDIGQGNFTNLFPAKANIAIGNAVMDGVGLLTGAASNIGIGNTILAGLTSGDRNVGIGNIVAGGITTGSDNTIFGYSAGSVLTTGSNNVIIGNTANVTAGAVAAGVAIGFDAIANTDCVAIGNNAGSATSSTSTVAIGLNAGSAGQGTTCVAIGANAGVTTQGIQAVALGSEAGKTNQGQSALAIGSYAGQTNQEQDTVAIGVYAGQTTQRTGAIAIGLSAGSTNQGSNSIAIGNSAGATNQIAGSIILNASGSTLDATTNAGFYVNPIRLVAPTSAARFAFYNNTTKELGSNPYIDFFGANITASLTLAIPLSTVYLVTAGTPTITLPTASATYIGAKLTFRRVVATNIFTFNQTGGASVMVGYNQTTGAASFTMSATQFSSTIICDGTNWFQLQTA